MKLTTEQMKDKHETGVALIVDYLRSQKCEVERIKRDTPNELDDLDLRRDRCEEYDMYKLFTPEEIDRFQNMKMKEKEDILKSRGYENTHMLYQEMYKKPEFIKKMVAGTKEEYRANKTAIRNYFQNIKKGDLYVKYPQFHEDMYLKIVNSDFLSSKSIANFKGRYVVFVNTSDVSKSRVMRRKSLESYFNTALKGAPPEAKTRPFNFKNFQNFCHIEDFGMYFTQWLIMNCDNDIENLRLLNETYFNKKLPRSAENPCIQMAQNLISYSGTQITQQISVPTVTPSIIDPNTIF